MSGILFYKGSTPTQELHLKELRNRGPDAFNEVDFIHPLTILCPNRLNRKPKTCHSWSRGDGR